MYSTNTSKAFPVFWGIFNTHALEMVPLLAHITLDVHKAHRHSITSKGIILVAFCMLVR